MTFFSPKNLKKSICKSNVKNFLQFAFCSTHFNGEKVPKHQGKYKCSFVCQIVLEIHYNSEENDVLISLKVLI